MIDRANAIQKTIHDNPEMKIISGIEYNEVFGFNLIPKNLAKNDMFANGCLYIVEKKTGKAKWMTSEEILNEWSWPPLSFISKKDINA